MRASEMSEKSENVEQTEPTDNVITSKKQPCHKVPVYNSDHEACNSSGLKPSSPSIPTSSSSQCTVHVTFPAKDQKPHLPGQLPSHVSRPGLQEARLLLQELMSPRHRSLAGPFTSEPQDPKYISNVQQPMWLELVQKRMDQGHYKSIGEVIYDLRLVLDNCYRFHGLGHCLSRRAQRFESLLEEKLALLPRALRELTSIAATSGGRYGGREDHGKSGLEAPGRVGETRQGVQTRAGAGGRSMSGRPTRRCGYESMMVSTIRHEEAQHAKEEKRQREVSRREADEEKERVAAQWEEAVCLRAHPTSLATRWELPAIGHFLCLAQQELGLPEVAYYELERCLLLPRASRFLAHLFTSLLLAPRDRAAFALGRCPPMPYKVWERRLRCKVRSWWDEVGSAPCPAVAADKLGLDSKFFLVLGERSPLEEKPFHDLPFLQRLWLLKGLCDHIYATEAAVQSAVLSWPIHECREVVLGYDSCSRSYLHFPQFCGADLRVYRQEPLGPPSVPGPAVFVQQFSCHTNVSISRRARLKRRGLSHSRCRARARSKMRRNRRYSSFAGIHHGSSPSSSSLPTLLRTSLPSSTCSTVFTTTSSSSSPSCKLRSQSSTLFESTEDPMRGNQMTLGVEREALRSREELGEATDFRIFNGHSEEGFPVNMRREQGDCAVLGQEGREESEVMQNTRKKQKEELTKEGMKEIQQTWRWRKKNEICTKDLNTRVPGRKGVRVASEPRFELVCSNLQELRELIADVQHEHQQLKKPCRKRSVKVNPKRKKVRELQETLERLLAELLPWEGRLHKAFIRMRAKLKREEEEFEKKGDQTCMAWNIWWGSDDSEESSDVKMNFKRKKHKKRNWSCDTSEREATDETIGAVMETAISTEASKETIGVTVEPKETADDMQEMKEEATGSTKGAPSVSPNAQRRSQRQILLAGRRKLLTEAPEIAAKSSKTSNSPTKRHQVVDQPPASNTPPKILKVGSHSLGNHLIPVSFAGTAPGSGFHLIVAPTVSSDHLSHSATMVLIPASLPSETTDAGNKLPTFGKGKVTDEESHIDPRPSSQLLQTLCFGDSHSIRVMTRTGNTGVVKVQSSFSCPSPTPLRAPTSLISAQTSLSAEVARSSVPFLTEHAASLAIASVPAVSVPLTSHITFPLGPYVGVPPPSHIVLPPAPLSIPQTTTISSMSPAPVEGIPPAGAPAPSRCGIPPAASGGGFLPTAIVGGVPPAASVGSVPSAASEGRVHPATSVGGVLPAASVGSVSPAASVSGIPSPAADGDDPPAATLGVPRASPVCVHRATPVCVPPATAVVVHPAALLVVSQIPPLVTLPSPFIMANQAPPCISTSSHPLVATSFHHHTAPLANPPVAYSVHPHQPSVSPSALLPITTSTCPPISFLDRPAIAFSARPPVSSSARPPLAFSTHPLLAFSACPSLALPNHSSISSLAPAINTASVSPFVCPLALPLVRSPTSFSVSSPASSSVSPLASSSVTPLAFSSACPIVSPSVHPLTSPSFHPLTSPSVHPLTSPSVHTPTSSLVCPLASPLVRPLASPSVHPLTSPSFHPLTSPSVHPLTSPSFHALTSPSVHTLASPSVRPLASPSVRPLKSPSVHTLASPSVHTLASPSVCPLAFSSVCPVVSPSVHPLTSPSVHTPASSLVRPLASPLVRPLASPSVHPLTSPSFHPLTSPSVHPLTSPSVRPLASPSVRPLASPSVHTPASSLVRPLASPSVHPLTSPSFHSLTSPSVHTLPSPSVRPLASPSVRPLASPSVHTPVSSLVRPLASPSVCPLASPSVCPLASPSVHTPAASLVRPLASPSVHPLTSPSFHALTSPSVHTLPSPSVRPLASPSVRPLASPSVHTPVSSLVRPLAFPLVRPLASPSVCPLTSPSFNPLTSPSVCPLTSPLVHTLAASSIRPLASPSVRPLAFPSVRPLASPSVRPEASPLVRILASPSIPSLAFSSVPPLPSSSVLPLASPLVRPLVSPLVCPLASPSVLPLASPSVLPLASPSVRPLASPSVRPLASPSVRPLASPSVCPLASPSVRPQASPSVRLLASPSIPPLAFSSVPPLPSSSVLPLASPLVRLLASPSIPPLAFSSVPPLPSSSVLPLASSSGSPLVSTSICPLVSLPIHCLTSSSVCSQITTYGRSFIMPLHHPLGASSARLLAAPLSHPLAAPPGPLATPSNHLVVASSTVPTVATPVSSLVATPTHPLIEISAPPIVVTTSNLSGSLVLPKYRGPKEGQAMITSLNLPPWLVKSQCTGTPRSPNSSYQLLVPCSIPNNRNLVVPINSHGSITHSSFQPSISKSQGLYNTTPLLTTKPSGPTPPLSPIIGPQVDITIAKVHHSASKCLVSSNSGTFNSATDFPVSLFLGSPTTSAPCALAIRTVKAKHLASSIVLAAPTQPVAHLPSLNTHSSLPPTHSTPSTSPSFTYSYSLTTANSSFSVSHASFPSPHHVNFSQETQLVYSQNAPTFATSHSSSFCPSFPYHSSSCTSFLTQVQYVSDASCSSVSPSTPCSSYSQFPTMSCLTSTVYCLASTAPCLTSAGTSFLSTKSFPSTLPFNLSRFSCASIPSPSFSFKSTPISSPPATITVASTSMSTPSLSSFDPLFSVSLTHTSASLPAATSSLTSTFVCLPSVLTLPNSISTSVNYLYNSLPIASTSIPSASSSTSFSVPSASVSLPCTSNSLPSTSISLPPTDVSLPPTTPVSLFSSSSFCSSLSLSSSCVSSSLANVPTSLPSSVILQFVPAVSLSQSSTTYHHSYSTLNAQSPLRSTLPNGVPLEKASQNIVRPVSGRVLHSSEHRSPNYCSTLLSSQVSAAGTLQNLPGTQTHKPHNPLAYLNLQCCGGLLVSPEGAILSSPVTASNIPVTAVSPMSIHLNQGTVPSSALMQISVSSSQSMTQPTASS
uniref:uncharacterized bromodomain-containing protein 10-like isoform X3 n=1 Tax=Myxine glutinosa TaxID=7769 RepID=UPI00358E9CA3